MPELPNSPNDRRNRIGCFVILAVLAMFVALYFLVGSNAAPDNTVARKFPLRVRPCGEAIMELPHLDCGPQSARKVVPIPALDSWT